MVGRIRAVILVFIGSLIAVGFSHHLGQASATIVYSGATMTDVQECAKCADICKPWVEQCSQGQQYSCYKALACQCKCNLKAGGCGSSKKYLRACYKENTKKAELCRANKCPKE
ncbi:MAG TPA: hypothetical protein VI306_21895 [Pyrinomonadaceae bacterium]